MKETRRRYNLRMKLIDRQAAASLGLVRYFDGKPCLHGHNSDRYVNGNGCVACALIRSANQPPTPSVYKPEQKAAYYLKNRDNILEKRRAKAAAARGITLHEYMAKLAAKNDPAIKSASKEERKRLHAKKDYQRNKDRYIAHNASRRAAKHQATPPWANLSEMRKIYRKSEQLTRETGIQHNVDHIIPLKSKFVCGLHCEQNLRVITQAANREKSNKFNPDTYVHELHK